MRILVFVLVALFSVASQAGVVDDKQAVTSKMLAPLIKLLRSDEINKASLPAYNQYRQSKGKRPVTYEEMKPVLQKSSQAVVTAYVESFSSEFSLDELKFLANMFSTKVGAEIMQSLSKSIASGAPHKPDFSHFTKRDQAEFEAAVGKNPELAKNFPVRVDRVNKAVQQKMAAFMKSNPALRLPD